MTNSLPNFQLTKYNAAKPISILNGFPSKKNRKEDIQLSSQSFVPFPEIAHDAHIVYRILGGLSNTYAGWHFSRKKPAGSGFKSRCRSYIFYSFQYTPYHFFHFLFAKKQGFFDKI